MEHGLGRQTAARGTLSPGRPGHIPRPRGASGFRAGAGRRTPRGPHSLPGVCLRLRHPSVSGSGPRSIPATGAPSAGCAQSAGQGNTVTGDTGTGKHGDKGTRKQGRKVTKGQGSPTPPTLSPSAPGQTRMSGLAGRAGAPPRSGSRSGFPERPLALRLAPRPSPSRRRYPARSPRCPRHTGPSTPGRAPAAAPTASAAVGVLLGVGPRTSQAEAGRAWAPPVSVQMPHRAPPHPTPHPPPPPPGSFS